MQIILASQSPRRQELLGLLKIPFTIRVADIDETMDPERSACDEVARISTRKALAIPHDADDLVIAADTIVVCEGRILGKPHSAEEAKAMLRLLSGCTHQVMTGMTLLKDGKQYTHTEITDVTFRKLSDRQIDEYVAGGEPMDKAGAYGIQGGAALFVEGIAGDSYNVVGLPVCRLWQLLGELAPELLDSKEDI